MTKTISRLEKSKEWKNLLKHAKLMKKTHLKELFQNDPQRTKKFFYQTLDILLDYSKNNISSKTLSLLDKFTQAQNLEHEKEKLFSGSFYNVTENRVVSHIQQRDPSHNMQKDTFLQMESFTKQIRSETLLSHCQKPFRYIINIGIGGSHLGLEMVIEALKNKSDSIKAFFVNNIDSHSLYQAIEQVNLDQTLFIISSKSFSTQETLANAQTAKDIVLKHFGGQTEAISKHFCATSNQLELTKKFGISKVFSIEESIGGRYSLWSCIGLPIALTLGFSKFEELHQGAHAMDNHFKEAPLQENLPTLLALIGIWNVNFLRLTTQAIIPYSEKLKFFPRFLQQLEMESNGKSVDKNGQFIFYQTCPILWGCSGTNSQHSFFQLLHQGTHICPADFLFVIQSSYSNLKHQDILASHFFAQTQALMKGKTLQEVQLENCSPNIENYKVFQGNKPTNSLILSKLNARTLGSLIALYEHKVFVQGVLWNIHSFDQWGVEFGKQLAQINLDKIKNLSSLQKNPLDTFVNDTFVNSYIKR